MSKAGAILSVQRPVHGLTVLLLAATVVTMMAGCSATRANPAAPSSRIESGTRAFEVAATGASSAAVAWSCLTAPGCAAATTGHARATAALTAPGSPNSLTASVSGSTVTLTWVASTSIFFDPASSFIVEAGSTPGASDIASFDTGSATPSLVATNVPDGLYYVRVRARNAAGQSNPTNPVAVMVAATACTPAAPTGLALFYNLETPVSVQFTWNPPDGACRPLSYEVDAGSTTGSSNLATLNTGSGTPSYFARTPPNGTFYIRVRAVKGDRLSDPSNEVVMVIPHPTTTTTTSGPLSGGWGGAPPNAGWNIDVATGVCVASRTVILQLTQAGSAVSGTLQEQFIAVVKSGCATSGTSYTFALTGTAGNPVGGNGTLTFTFTDEQGALITFTGTYTPTTITGTLQGPGTPAGTLLVNKS